MNLSPLGASSAPQQTEAELQAVAQELVQAIIDALGKLDTPTQLSALFCFRGLLRGFNRENGHSSVLVTHGADGILTTLGINTSPEELRMWLTSAAALFDATTPTEIH
jgi:hypothetical protein